MAQVHLVGRGPEKKFLSGMLERSFLGNGRSAIILGQPGIGKTMLMDWFCESAGAKGAE